MLTRRGASLPELLVALALGGIILSVATVSLLRQQRTAGSLSRAARSAGQLRLATALVAAELGALEVGDLVSGELRDTALELRGFVASGISCDSGLVAAFATSDDLSAGGSASPPREGDSLWWHPASGAGWTGREVRSVREEPQGCGTRAGQGVPGLRLWLSGTDTVPVRAPLRVTRPSRLVVYRSGDGTWQLGVREWNASARTLASPQPAAGPFQRVAGAGAKTGFRYFDATGGELAPAADPAASRAVARVRFTAVMLAPGRQPSDPGAFLRESTDVALRAGPPP